MRTILAVVFALLVSTSPALPDTVHKIRTENCTGTLRSFETRLVQICRPNAGCEDLHTYRYVVTCEGRGTFEGPRFFMEQRFKGFEWNGAAIAKFSHTQSSVSPTGMKLNQVFKTLPVGFAPIAPAWIVKEAPRQQPPVVAATPSVPQQRVATPVPAREIAPTHDRGLWMDASWWWFHGPLGAVRGWTYLLILAASAWFARKGTYDAFDGDALRKAILWQTFGLACLYGITAILIDNYNPRNASGYHILGHLFGIPAFAALVGLLGWHAYKIARYVVKGFHFVFVAHAAERVVNPTLGTSAALDTARLREVLDFRPLETLSKMRAAWRYENEAAKAQALTRKLTAETELARAAVARQRAIREQEEERRRAS